MPSVFHDANCLHFQTVVGTPPASGALILNLHIFEKLNAGKVNNRKKEQKGSSGGRGRGGGPAEGRCVCFLSAGFGVSEVT